MSDQPPRFAVRSKILQDHAISHAAVRLFLFLDDESRGEDRLSLKQSGQFGLCSCLGLKERQLRTLLRELQDGRYLRIYRTPTGNVYEFHRQKTAGRETTNRQKTAGPTGNKLPVHLYIQESIQEPPTPLRENENQITTPKAKPKCQRCGGVGLVQGVVRGIGFVQDCPDCAGAIRRSA